MMPLDRQDKYIFRDIIRGHNRGVGMKSILTDFKRRESHSTIQKVESLDNLGGGNHIWQMDKHYGRFKRDIPQLQKTTKIRSKYKKSQTSLFPTIGMISAADNYKTQKMADDHTKIPEGEDIKFNYYHIRKNNIKEYKNEHIKSKEMLINRKY